MPTEAVITSWRMLPWKEETSKEELLKVRIRQMEGRKEDIVEGGITVTTKCMAMEQIPVQPTTQAATMED